MQTYHRSEKDAMTLRYLDTMREVSSGSGKSTVIFPVPMDLAGALGKVFKQ